MKKFGVSDDTKVVSSESLKEDKSKETNKNNAIIEEEIHERTRNIDAIDLELIRLHNEKEYNLGRIRYLKGDTAVEPNEVKEDEGEVIDVPSIEDIQPTLTEQFGSQSKYMDDTIRTIYESRKTRQEVVNALSPNKDDNLTTNKGRVHKKFFTNGSYNPASFLKAFDKLSTTLFEGIHHKDKDLRLNLMCFKILYLVMLKLKIGELCVEVPSRQSIAKMMDADVREVKKALDILNRHDILYVLTYANGVAVDNSKGVLGQENRHIIHVNGLMFSRGDLLVAPYIKARVAELDKLRKKNQQK